VRGMVSFLQQDLEVLSSFPIAVFFPCKVFLYLDSYTHA
jgi:hypothetical protein